jgi:hypothetical protein
MGEVIRKKKKQGCWSPYLQATVDKVLSKCEICVQNNIRKEITTPIGHILVPEGPYQHIVIDYMDMTSARQKIHTSSIDRFSRWI